MNVTIGGPSYNYQVDARHASMVARLAVLLSKRSHVVDLAYGHACPVEVARNALFADALKSRADVLLWIDSDIFTASPGDLVPMIERLGPLNPETYPLIGATCKRRDGMLAAHPGDREHFEIIPGGVVECLAVGFGCVAFDLAWYRSRWPNGPWFWGEWIQNDLSGVEYVSEDYRHCLALQEYGGSAWIFGASMVHVNRDVYAGTKETPHVESDQKSGPVDLADVRRGA